MRRALPLLVLLALAAAGPSGAAAPALTATVEPAEPLFGDTFSYVVRVTTDADSAAGARILADVGPFTRVGPTRTTRSAANGRATITVTETLACLTAGCVPSTAGRVVSLPPARVTVGGVETTAAPVPVRVGSRVSTAEVRAETPALRRPQALPRATFRLSPSAGAAVLALAGIALVTLGLALLAAPLRGRRRRGAAPDRVDPVRRAARLLRESAGRDAADRRRAAALAARVAPGQDLSVDAAAVAWSRPEPAPPDATSLADRIERTAVKGT